MSEFAATPQALDAEQITGYLRQSGCLDDGRVASVECELIGNGKMGDNARFRLRYDGPAARAPATLVGKFPAADEHARAMAGAQGAYRNEVMFYRELAPQTSMRTPRIYASELSDDGTRFMLLMEDMAPAEPGDQIVGETQGRARAALAQAARLAASFYGDDGLAARDYVMTPARDDGGAFGQQLMEQSWPGFLDRFGHGLSSEAIAFGERYVRGHAHFVTRLQGPKTLVHGDFRSENILFAPDAAVTVDWQTSGESSVLADAAYFLGGSLELANRRAWEKFLIEEYRQLLAEQGVELSAQDCWDQYREYAMHGVLITVLGASFSSPDERGERMFMAMIQRHLQHCIDLDAGEFLPR